MNYQGLLLSTIASLTICDVADPECRDTIALTCEKALTMAGIPLDPAPDDRSLLDAIHTTLAKRNVRTLTGFELTKPD